jgi:hypothetical protein
MTETKQGNWSYTLYDKNSFSNKKRDLLHTNLLDSIKITFVMSLYFMLLGVILFSYFEYFSTNIFSFAQIPANNIGNSGSYSNFPDSGSDVDKGPAFLDAYWTNYLSTSASNNNTLKKEVGPGDGTSTLAVVLVNKGRSDITGVTGFLNLPRSAFVSIPGKNNGTFQSVASANSIVKTGDTFVLYFDMNVLKQAEVGGYNASLVLKYTKINQLGELTSTTIVPFRLTGKVILDAIPENSQLTPSTSNQLKILIQNKGSATAAGVVVRVTGITSGTTTSTSSTSTMSNSNPTSSSTNTTTSNSGVEQPTSSSNPAVNIGATVFDIGTIRPNGSTAIINPLIYPSSAAGETVQNMNLQITYGDAYGNQQISNIPIGLVISPTPPQSVLNATTNHENALIITSGKIQDLNLTLANGDTKPITNVVASLTSQSSAMQILGDSRWTFPDLSPQSKMNLNTKVFASSSLVGQPALFTLTVDYISAGQSKTDVLNIGSYISGDIKLRIYDVGLNFISGKPNIVGNILNEGNTVGLFTTIELVKAMIGKALVSSSTPPQYLGDLSVDSPLPFSIPINIDNKTLSGTYPVMFKFAYSDDLKNSHQLLVNNSVDLKQKSVRSTNSGNDNTIFGFIPGSLSNNMSLFIIAIVSIVVIIVVIILRKRRSKSKDIRLQSRNDMDSFLTDFSTYDANTSTNNLEKDHLQKELSDNQIREKQKGKETKK